ncbi:MAG: hypothetical protein ACRESQ_06160 [Gammaproteobacteria bacterium]
MQKVDGLDWVIVVAAGIFIGILFISAWWDPTIRWLHFFQAWLYIATIILVLRKNPWGYLFGAATAAFWVYVNLFITNFFRAGREQLEILLSQGTLPRPDLSIAVPAVAANLAIVVGGLWAYGRVRIHQPVWQDVGTFVICTGISAGYFAADIAIFQPRYLPLFGRLLAPHLHI